MAIQRLWTLEELDRLPDDGNKYELVRGELFVTPAPAPGHEEVLARLHEVLGPFVLAHRLGRVYRPRAVIQLDGSQVEPDLMVRKPAPANTVWAKWPAPVLVVEAVSSATRRRDYEQKREFYLDLGVDEYWIVDAKARSVCVVRQSELDRDERSTLVWSPRGAIESLQIDLKGLFD